jgi:predicted permease
LYSELAAIIAPIFICSGIGYAWARLDRPFDPQFVTALVSMVGAPCLVASTLTRLDLGLAEVGQIAGATLIAAVGFALSGLLLLKLLRLPAHSYLPALMFPNAGNMGLPLCLFAFGEAGLALAIVYFAVFSCLQFTLGMAIAAGRFEPSRILRMPLIYALAAAFVFMGTGTPMPRWAANTLDLIGGLTIPLMLLALGVSLARLKIRSVPRSLGLALMRLVGGLAIGAGIGWGLDLDQPARGVLIIQSAMPVAVFNYLFAQLYGRAPEEVAGMIVLSTLISFVTLPVLLLLAL